MLSAPQRMWESWNSSDTKGRDAIKFRAGLALGGVGMILAAHYGAKFAARHNRYMLELDLVNVQVTHHTVRESILSKLSGDGPTISVRTIVEGLRRASKDDKVAGIVVRLGKPSTGLFDWGQIQDFRSAIDDFNKSGKISIAYSESLGMFVGGPSAYYLASAFSRVYLCPTGDVSLTGLAVETTFLKQMFDKLHITPRTVHRKDFKTFANTFDQDSYTDAHKKYVTEFVTELDGQLRSDIEPEILKRRNELRKQVIVEARETMERLEKAAKKGKKSEDSVASDAEEKSAENGVNYELEDIKPSALMDTLMDQGPYLAPRALALGLVDDLLFSDEVYDRIPSLLKMEKKHIKHLFLKVYLQKKGRPFNKKLAKNKKSIALVELCGGIHSGPSSPPGRGGPSIGADTVIRILRSIGKDKSTAAVVLRINSGGGSAIASDVIGREVVRLKAKGIKVVASMADVAASGGYWIASYGDRILAQPATVTGSIGVVMLKLVTRQFWQDHIGVTYDEFRTNDNSAMFSSLHDFSQKHADHVDKMLDLMYDKFLERVARSRKLSKEQVEEVAQGRVWTGAEAKAHGLIDEFGGYLRAVDLCHELVGIEPGDQRMPVKVFPKQVSMLKELTANPENEAQRVGLEVFSAVDASSYLPTSVSSLVRVASTIESFLATPALRSIFPRGATPQEIERMGRHGTAFQGPMALAPIM